MRKLARLLAPLEASFGRAYRASCGHRKYGLFYDDVLIETPEVEEAVRRLPEDVRDARLRRQKLAFHLYVQGQELPQEQQPTDEEDVRYLLPFLNEVEEEAEARLQFRNQ